ncbi:MAG: hypothetical protein HQ511_02525 [Rhodospirillales bacterium]|nr:hypothetical protein [Rhodospirillales bacterium]
MTDRQLHSKLRPLAVVAVMMLAGLVLFTSPKRQLVIEYGSALRAVDAAGCMD